MTPIQSTIRDYLKDGPPSDHTMRCFMGMLETGEATILDFAAVGGTRWLYRESPDSMWRLVDFIGRGKLAAK
jgi:hypothetical protein